VRDKGHCRKGKESNRGGSEDLGGRGDAQSPYKGFVGLRGGSGEKRSLGLRLNYLKESTIPRKKGLWGGLHERREGKKEKEIVRGPTEMPTKGRELETKSVRCQLRGRKNVTGKAQRKGLREEVTEKVQQVRG